MASPVSSEKKKRVSGTPTTRRDEDYQSKSRRESVPRDMLQVCGQDEPAKESPLSDFKTPATENSPLDVKRSGNFTPKTPEAPLRDHGPFTRRSIYEKELPRKALFQGPESPREFSSEYKTPDLSHQKMSLDSTSDGKPITAPSTHPQEAPRKSLRSHSRLLNNPEADMVLQPRSLFQEPALPESP